MKKEKIDWLFGEYNRGVCLAQAGEYHEAALILRRILPDFEAAGEPNTIMKCLTTLASITSQLPDLDSAINDTTKVIKFAKSIGDSRREHSFSSNLTKLYLFKGEQALRSGDIDRAIEIYKMTLELAKRTGDFRDEGRSLGNIATIYSMKGDYKLALEFHKKAIELFEFNDNMESYALEYANMANAYLNLKQFKKAFDMYQEVLANHDKRIAEHTRYSCLKGTAICAQQLGDWTVAQKYYKIVLDIAVTKKPIREVEFLENCLLKVNQKQKLDPLQFGKLTVE